MGRRRPHVPSSKPTMSKNQPNKSGGQPSFPAFYFGGLAVRLCWRPNRETVEAAFPSGERASKGGFRFGQQGIVKKTQSTPSDQGYSGKNGGNPGFSMSDLFKSALTVRISSGGTHRLDRFKSLTYPYSDRIGAGLRSDSARPPFVRGFSGQLPAALIHRLHRRVVPLLLRPS